MGGILGKFDSALPKAMRLEPAMKMDPGMRLADKVNSKVRVEAERKFGTQGASLLTGAGYGSPLEASRTLLGKSNQ